MARLLGLFVITLSTIGIVYCGPLDCWKSAFRKAQQDVDRCTESGGTMLRGICIDNKSIIRR